MPKKRTEKKESTNDAIVIANLETRLVQVVDRLEALERRIDRIVDAISKSKKVKGL